ncbi:hypothetical protein T492DRAFT_1124000, partial [Pavlovales sp. CCMP2436]
MCLPSRAAWSAAMPAPVHGGGGQLLRVPCRQGSHKALQIAKWHFGMPAELKQFVAKMIADGKLAWEDICEDGHIAWAIDPKIGWRKRCALAMRSPLLTRPPIPRTPLRAPPALASAARSFPNPQEYMAAVKAAFVKLAEDKAAGVHKLQPTFRMDEVQRTQILKWQEEGEAEAEAHKLVRTERTAIVLAAIA